MSKPRQYLVRINKKLKIKDFVGPVCKPCEVFTVIEKSAYDKAVEALKWAHHRSVSKTDNWVLKVEQTLKELEEL